MHIFYDIEVYPNFFCMVIKTPNKTIVFEKDQVKKELFSNKNIKWIGFNNRRYDHPILEKVLQGYSHHALFNLSKSIIYEDNNLISWDENIIDLLEICPKKSKCSLKEFGHRLQYPTLENLPFPYEEALTNDQKKIVKKYNVHDVNITALLWEKLKPEYEAREGLQKFFDIKTAYGGAPRLSEKCILSKLNNEKITNTKQLIKMNNLVLSETSKKQYNEAFNMSLNEYGEGKRPDFMSSSQNINGLKVKFGVGGLHAFNKSGVYQDVYEYDVSSYYPSIILNCRLGSPEFRQIYKLIYTQRFLFKSHGKKEEESLKLVLNSLYGKLRDHHANRNIYAPNLAITICLLGQFYLIDLIEKLEYDNIILANTDSVIVKNKIPEHTLNEWQNRTGLSLKTTHYPSFIAKDVNSIYAIDDNGHEKRTGEFLKPIWTHNVRAPIIQKAAINYLLHGIDVKNTIEKVDATYEYCFFVKCRGEQYFLIDGVKSKEKRLRYYCSNDGVILEKQTEKRKAKAHIDTKITLAMDLKLTNEIAYNWYIKETNKLIKRVLCN